MTLVVISNDFKYLRIREDVQNSNLEPIAGPKFKTDGFLMTIATELRIESWRQSHKSIGCQLSLADSVGVGTFRPPPPGKNGRV